MGVALPVLAAGHRRDDVGEASHRGPMASQGLPALLAVAITPSGTTQDWHRSPCFDPPNGTANPLWGAPRIHGELLKLGIKISQATVGRWMPWRPKVPSPTWRSFLRNHLSDIAAIDMFVVATATFRLLYTLIVLSLDRRRVHAHANKNRRGHRPERRWSGSSRSTARSTTIRRDGRRTSRARC